MRYQLSEQFRKKYKKQNIRIRKAIDSALRKFVENPFDATLDNHELHKELRGMRSIDITADFRAIYELIQERDGFFAYFENFGTHKELFQ